MRARYLPLLMPFLLVVAASNRAQAATDIPFTINLSEAVLVTGTPRVAVDVGGVTRYAIFSGGSGTSALTFTLSPQTGDVDLDGITVSSPIDLNGGTIKDAAGNNAVLTFTPPNTSGIKVNYPSLGMDFVYDADGRYTLNGTAYNDLPAFLSAAGGTFARTSTGTYFDSAGTLQTATAGTPRFDYDPVTHLQKGLLIEDSRTNLLTYAEQFDDASWSKQGLTVSANVIATPSGATTGDKIVESAANVLHALQRTLSLSANTTRTVSIYAKAGERNWLRVQADDGASNTANANFNLTTCTLGLVGGSGSYTSSASTQSVGNGWCRCQLKYSVSTVTTRLFLSLRDSDGFGSSAYAGDGTSGLYVWGAQIETGVQATSYISTGATTVTRAADALTIPTASWFNAMAGSLFAQSMVPVLGGPSWPGSISIDDGSANNAFHMYVNDNIGDTKSAQIFTAGTGEFSANGSAYTAGNTLKQALNYETNYARFAYDGTLSSADTTLTLPTVSVLRVGSGRSGSSVNILNGYVQKIKYYPARLADTQLQQLTQ